MINKETIFSKDLPNKRLTVERSFDASLDLVWKAWTESEILDQWWAPHPYKAVTKTMSFKEGGYWLYAMTGPEGDKQWCVENFKTIEAQKRITNTVSFCDEAAKINTAFPTMSWEKKFHPNGETTVVKVDINFDKEEDLKTIVEMGFQEGFKAGLDNLDHYLETHFRLRKQNKTSNAPRVSSYLNFAGKTEEAFNFYKKVFKTEFSGKGLQRFEDIDLPGEHPPMSDADKKLIIHVELTILGGHVLMATDAPESMGFKLHQGNNMHICLEPDTRAETERLFKELSEGGTITMPLADMFFGAYFAEFTDKYGINWMLNHQTV
ncbi:MAG: SRPBCC domain-containing protein [Filimonas sp.]|nr:SRPBCC domain-containing protein [Filimonas sp.]